MTSNDFGGQFCRRFRDEREYHEAPCGLEARLSVRRTHGFHASTSGVSNHFAPYAFTPVDRITPFFHSTGQGCGCSSSRGRYPPDRAASSEGRQGCQDVHAHGRGPATHRDNGVGYAYHWPTRRIRRGAPTKGCQGPGPWRLAAGDHPAAAAKSGWALSGRAAAVDNGRCRADGATDSGPDDAGERESLGSVSRPPMVQVGGQGRGCWEYCLKSVLDSGCGCLTGKGVAGAVGCRVR